MKAWRVILAALVIFAAGVVTGGLTIRLQSPPAPLPAAPSGFGPLRQRHDLMDRMQRQLYLTPTQRARIEQILHDSHDRMKQLWDSIAPQAQQEHRHVRDLIRDELNPVQQKQFEELFKNRGPVKPGEERRRREDGRDQKPPRKLDTNSAAPNSAAESGKARP